MEEGKTYRLSKVASEFNVAVSTILEFLNKKGHKIDSNPNTKITGDVYDILVKEYHSEKQVKEVSKKIDIGIVRHESVTVEKPRDKEKDTDVDDDRELLIKNVPPANYAKEKDPDAKAIEKPTPKAAEPVAELPVEEVKEKKVKEKVKEVEEPSVEPEVIEEPVKPVKKASAKAKTEVPVEEVPVVEPEKEIEPIPEEPVKEDESGIRIVGKIDLDALRKSGSGKKPKKEIKKKGAKEEPEAVEETAKEVAAPETQPETITPEVISETPAEVVTPETPIADVAPEVIEIVPPVRDENFIETEYTKLEGPKILGKIELKPPVDNSRKLVASSADDKLQAKKKKRKRIKKATPASATAPGAEAPKTENKAPKSKFAKPKKEIRKTEVSEDEIDKQIKETLARLSAPTKSKASKYRRQKRDQVMAHAEEEMIRAEEDKKVLKATEFVTANELAQMMNVKVTEVISTCMTLGLFVSINQRLDAETLAIVAEEFGYKVEFVSADVQEAIQDDIDAPEDLISRHPIVTVMGHVDHGKTSLLDYIRRSNVIAGEAGGITQHIGAYLVKLDNGKKITFLDTPGHEAFTAMRARGAAVTDISIVVVAADDHVMPQTIEAINHSQAAKVPIVFAINKIDKDGANPERIREDLSKMNILVEEWGGKYQCQEISAKKGINVESLLEKVLLEAEMLDLKANPSRRAMGTVLESSLEKGRGYVAKLLVQNGTLRVGDVVLAGYAVGRVKAMYNERNQKIDETGPATPVLMLGLSGAPQAGDAFNVMADEHEAKEIANKRMQLQREQGLRTQKHITLDEIGRRIAIGDFKELNIIIKGDVDGSVEALSDSLLKLSTKEVLVNVIHKSVGQITESDVLLASASNAIIIGFQVRPSLNARKLAEAEQIDIRLYSIIYTAINELKSAIEGMLSPEIEEKITCNLEIREVFKITKVGTIAGCFVLDGKISRNSKIRIIRNGIVVYTGLLGSLKRFKDEAKEVNVGLECGLNIENFNDIKVGDIIEGYEEFEVKRKL
ncbi:MAG: translation initiation factor IF-2 [Bacteroidota bacterium]